MTVVETSASIVPPSGKNAERMPPHFAVS